MLEIAVYSSTGSPQETAHCSTNVPQQINHNSSGATELTSQL